MNLPLQVVALTALLLIGHVGGLSLAQFKITQEVLTLAMFVAFAMLYMASPSSSTSSGPACVWWAPSISFSAADQPLHSRGFKRVTTTKG